MAEGTKTYMGLAIPLHGEYEQVQQVLATDMVTLTGAASISGDFLVCQDSTGSEVFVIGASGSFAPQQQQLTVSATTQIAGMNIVVSSTGALNALGTAETSVTGITVSPDSDAIMNSAFVYAGGSTATGNTAITFMAQMGANSGPSYFLAVPTTTTDAIYKGAHSGDNGFLDASLLSTQTWDCDLTFIGIKCLSGSQTIYLLATHASNIA